MSTSLQVVGSYRASDYLQSERVSTANRAIVALLVIGMLASSVCLVSYHEANRSQLKANEFYSADVVKSQVYYAAHAAHIVCLTLAGGIALLTFDSFTVDAGYIWRFLAFIGAGLLMTLRGFPPDSLLTTKIFDGSGPFPLFMSSIIFIGVRRSTWDVIKKLMLALAVGSAALTFVGISRLRTFSRQEAVANLADVLNVLYWASSWIALDEYGPNNPWRHWRLVPMLIYTVGSLFVQTRLNFVMIAALLVAYLYVQYKRRSLRMSGWIVTLVAILWLAMFVTIFMRDSKPVERVANVAAAFSSRIDEDTRTGQLVWFAETVAPSELILGRGSLATWDWEGTDWAGGTDVGYLTLLLYGGLPLLLTYIWSHVAPGLRALGKDHGGPQCAAACIVLLWAVRMFSSSYPNMSLEYYPVLMCIGISIYREPHFART